MTSKRDRFIAQLREGRSATLAVQEVTGIMPEIVTIASHDDPVLYVRYGVMMSGPMMAAIVTLKLDQGSIPSELMERIKAGEPCGAVLGGLTRRCRVIEHGIAVQSMASIAWYGTFIGNAQEVFTHSLFKENPTEPMYSSAGLILLQLEKLYASAPRQLAADLG